MKKTLKFLVPLLIGAAFAFSFASCSSDDGDGGNQQYYDDNSWDKNVDLFVGHKNLGTNWDSDLALILDGALFSNCNSSDKFTLDFEFESADYYKLKICANIDDWPELKSIVLPAGMYLDEYYGGFDVNSSPLTFSLNSSDLTAIKQSGMVIQGHGVTIKKVSYQPSNSLGNSNAGNQGGSGNADDSSGNGNGGSSGSENAGVWSSNIYLEIMSFSYKTNDFNGGTFIKLDSSTTEEFKRKLNTEYTMATLGTTKLYYSFHKALTNLSNYQFPDNLKSVNIITFTDGLDLASSGPSWEDTEFDSAEEYGAWIKNEIETRTISGLKLNCHSVGVQGEDLNGQTDLFKKSLSFITSNGNTPYIESDITKVAEAFSSIANNLTVRQTLYDLTLEIPRGATVVRMVFDGFDGMSSMDALRSRVYLEGTISNKTIEITAHPGLILETDKVSGTPMYDKEGFDMGNDSYPFRNMQFTDDASNYVDVSNHKFNKDTCKQFYKSNFSSSFIPNSEYDASEHSNPVEDKFSTVIYLILDATSSLGKENVEEVRKAAINFVDTLAEKAQADN